MKVSVFLTITLLIISTQPSCFAETPKVNFQNKIHQYLELSPQDPFSSFKIRLENGEIKLNFDSEIKYLESLLSELSISPSSQLLVYSTTSLQLSRISPYNPRAIYFTDDIYIGYVPGGQIEVIGIDPQLGAIPYIFNLPKSDDLKHPTIYRSKRCMKCHASHEIGGAPGLLVSSVVAGPGGGTIDRFRKQDFGHGVSFNQRFGGWHITGEHPFNKSWANQTGMMINNEVHKVANPPGKYFSWNKYLTNESHIVPHLIFEHQIGFINRCISTTYRFRELQLRSEQPHFRQHENKFIESETNSLLSYILFQNEAQLPPNQITKETKFIVDFEKTEKSNLGSTQLRKLNLKNRLFENRCSYMIFSSSFRGLPGVIKKSLFHKLKVVLSAKQSELPSEYSYLKEDERVKILSILSQSFQGFPNS